MEKNIIVWNVRGFNLPSREKKMLNLIQEKKIGLFGVIETRVKVENKSRVMDLMGNKWKWCDNYNNDPTSRIIVGWDPCLFA